MFITSPIMIAHHSSVFKKGGAEKPNPKRVELFCIWMHLNTKVQNQRLRQRLPFAKGAFGASASGRSPALHSLNNYARKITSHYRAYQRKFRRIYSLADHKCRFVYGRIATLDFYNEVLLRQMKYLPTDNILFRRSGIAETSKNAPS